MQQSTNVENEEKEKEMHQNHAVAIEALEIPDHLKRDLFRAGFKAIEDLRGETEESLRRISKSGRHNWGARSVEKLQVALEKAGHNRLPRIIPNK